jgi:hypothetical protein
MSIIRVGRPKSPRMTPPSPPPVTLPPASHPSPKPNTCNVAGTTAALHFFHHSLSPSATPLSPSRTAPVRCGCSPRASPACPTAACPRARSPPRSTSSTPRAPTFPSASCSSRRSGSPRAAEIIVVDNIMSSTGPTNGPWVALLLKHMRYKYDPAENEHSTIPFVVRYIANICSWA